MRGGAFDLEFFLTAYGILAWRRLTGVANDRGRLTEWGLDQGGGRLTWIL